MIYKKPFPDERILHDRVRMDQRSRETIVCLLPPFLTGSNDSRGAANPGPNFASGKHDAAASAVQRDAALIAGEIT